MGVIISVANQKGGVGKTTSVHNLGVALARFHKKKVLLIDLDAQGNLTDSCGAEPSNLSLSMYNVMEGTAEPKDAMINLEDRLDLLPANQAMAGAELNFSSRIGRENLLKKALQKLSNGTAYDIVLVDCPPALGLLTVNAFCASNYLLVPIQAEYHALAGLAYITNTLQEIVDNELNPFLDVLGVFLTFYDSRRNLNTGVAKALQDTWGKKLLKTRIRDNVSLAEAPSHSKDIFSYRNRSLGGEDYTALAKELCKLLKARKT